ncbi:hypothetical protein V8C37DRAFT_399059 [Trichoderma ceciliae]
MVFTNEAGTLLGPLTKTWAMPESCSIYLEPCSTCNQGFAGQSCNAVNGGQVQDNTECWPPVRAGIASPTWPFIGWGFYSPGLACPKGYVTACTAVYGQRPQWDIQFTLVSSETAVGCCPPGFGCINGNGNQCALTVTDQTAIPTAFCDGTSIVDSAGLTFPNVVTVTQTDTASGTITEETSTSTQTLVLYAPMFQLNFQATDLPASTTTTSTAPSTSGTTATTTSPNQQSTTSVADNDTSSKSSGGLSSGAKIGLGVGIGLGVAFILSFIAFIYYYRRSRRAQSPLGSELPNNQVSEVNEVPKIKQSPAQVYEMGTYHAPVELHGDNLEGGYQGRL